eukprot:11198147-Lingulodinium_polyedra.AAC.1
MEVERLMCAAIDEEERRAVQHKLQQRRVVRQSARIPPARVQRRLKAVEAERKAGPGPSCWRNSYIAGMGEPRGGVAQLQFWTGFWPRGR